MVFFMTGHDPTTVNQQGADVASQYSSVVYYINEVQKEIAEEVVKQIHFIKIVLSLLKSAP